MPEGVYTCKIETERTFSVCPVCGRRLPAERVRKEGGIYLQKTCPEHGAFSAILWRNRRDWADWRGEIPLVREEECRNCGSCGGLCAEHRRDTCCTLLEITGRCNMNCTFCFAGECREQDPSLEQVKTWISGLCVPGKTFLQLSGGEPSMREDLPEIIRFAKECGCRYIQLNTNGIRLAEEPGYAKKLAEAGLSFVFLQFDGVTEDAYKALRKRPLLELKKKVVENCGEAGLGVTLVPVIVPGVNDSQVGEIIRFGVSLSPVVRGVHFQPVSYFGRIPGPPADEDRYTLDQLLEAVVSQTEGLIREENLAPSCCDHPLCGFHGDFVVMPDCSLMPLTFRQRPSCCCGGEEKDPAEQNRNFIGRRWERKPAEAGSKGAAPAGTGAKPDMTDINVFLERVKHNGFTVTSMAFQDAWNLDFERLRQCSLHVARAGRLIPFCAAYLTCTGEGEKALPGEDKEDHDC